MAPARWPCVGCTGLGAIQRPRMRVSLKEWTQEIQPLPQACVALWILALPPRLGSARVCSPVSLYLPQRQPCQRTDFESKTILPMGLAQLSYTWSRDLLKIFFNKLPIDGPLWESRQDMESQDLNLWAKGSHRKNLNKWCCQKGKGPEKKGGRIPSKKTAHTHRTNKQQQNKPPSCSPSPNSNFVFPPQIYINYGSCVPWKFVNIIRFGKALLASFPCATIYFVSWFSFLRVCPTVQLKG